MIRQPTVREGQPADLEERSMRVIEYAMAGLAIAAAVVLALVR